MIALAAILSAWLQYGADGLPHARAVTTATSCPTVTVDTKTLPMRVRAQATQHFNDIVCDASIPPASKHVRIGDRTLPAPPAKIERVVA
jgi:hypothetical protein